MAFARLSDGQIAARGLARTLEYRRVGGRLLATQASAELPPAGGGLASLGPSTVEAPTVTGETTARHARASGGVQFAAVRGDRGATEVAEYDGNAGTVRSSTPVWLRGPGYDVRGRSFSARTDGTRIDVKGDVRGAAQVGAGR